VTVSVLARSLSGRSTIVIRRTRAGRPRDRRSRQHLATSSWIASSSSGPALWIPGTAAHGLDPRPSAQLVSAIGRPAPDEPAPTGQQLVPAWTIAVRMAKSGLRSFPPLFFDSRSNASKTTRRSGPLQPRDLQALIRCDGSASRPRRGRHLAGCAASLTCSARRTRAEALAGSAVAAGSAMSENRRRPDPSQDSADRL